MDTTRKVRFNLFKKKGKGNWVVSDNYMVILIFFRSILSSALLHLTDLILFLCPWGIELTK